MKKELYDKLLDNLAVHLESFLPNHAIAETYRYACLPPGKLFRPGLVASLALDMEKTALDPQSPHALLASAVELHHSYSLAHDDLPCMDNDLIRRGKPSLHAAYGDWKAVLVGDGLLNASWGLLAKISHPHLPELLKLFSWALGPKGLIQGQVLDLSGEMSLDFDTLIRTHTLKTARLIQVCLCGSYLLTCKDRPSLRTFLDFFKLGHHLGIAFQLIDDLNELNSPLSEHERAINPWTKSSTKPSSTLKKSIGTIKTVLKKRELPRLQNMITTYLDANTNHLTRV